MQIDQFNELFLDVLETAAVNAEKIVGHPVPRNYKISLFGAGYSGQLIDVSEAVKALYISPDKFYFVIDVAVQKITNENCVLFVRVSGHKPTEFQNTLNRPEGNGPFKQIEGQIEDLTV